MNVQKDQIQALIAEIDEVLNQPSLRLPWVVFGDTVTRSRQVLERVRNYLITLEGEADQSVGITPSEPNQPLSGSLREPLWQAIRREMVYLRTHLTQPLQDEVDRLRQEHRSLMQDIQQLEARKAQTLVSLQPPAYQQQLSREFLQELMTRLQDTLIQNVTETLSHIETRFLDSILLPEANTTAVHPALPEEQNTTATSGSQLSPRLTPAQRLEQMRQLQAQSDHLLMTLDSSLSVIFEALQRNLQTYSDSLGQSIERMHSLGQQGEVMFTSWVNQLAQHVGEETSSYLQSSLHLTSSEETSSSVPTADPTPPVMFSPEPEPENAEAEELLPYAGTEFPKQNFRGEDSPSTLLEQLETRGINAEQVDFDELVTIIEEESDSRLELEDRSLPPTEELAFPLDLEDTFSETEAESVFSPQLNNSPQQTEEKFFESEDLNEASSDLDLLFTTSLEETSTPNQSPSQQSDRDELDTDEEAVTMTVSDGAQTEDKLALEREVPTFWNQTTEAEVEEEEEQSWNPEDLFEQESISNTDRLDVQTEKVTLDEDLFLEEPDTTSLPSSRQSPKLKQITTPQVVARHPFEETLADFSDIFEELTLNEGSSDPNAGIVSARTRRELTQSIPTAAEPIQPRQEPVEADDYIPASQEENLLPQSEELDSEQIDTHLMIDRNTIEQLEADLFNLEQIEPSLAPSRSKRKNVTPKPERSVAAAVAQPRTQPIEAKSVPSRPEEVITFDDLFNELGMGSGSAKTSSSGRNQAPDQDLAVKTFSDLTLDDVFESFDLGMEVPVEFQSETEEPLSLEALGEEIGNPLTNPIRATTKRMKS